MNRVQLTGHINGRVHNTHVEYLAASPADVRTSISGSGLPYENAHQAFEDTPNTGSLILGPRNRFSIDLFTPNSYYEYSNDFGKVLVPPCVYITYDQRTVRVRLASNHTKMCVPIDDESEGSEDQWVIFKKFAHPPP